MLDRENGVSRENHEDDDENDDDDDDDDEEEREEEKRYGSAAVTIPVQASSRRPFSSLQMKTSLPRLRYDYLADPNQSLSIEKLALHACFWYTHKSVIAQYSQAIDTTRFAIGSSR